MIISNLIFTKIVVKTSETIAQIREELIMIKQDYENAKELWNQRLATTIKEVTKRCEQRYLKAMKTEEDPQGIKFFIKLFILIDESDKSDSSQQDDALDELQQRIKMLQYDLAAEVEKHKNTKGKIMFFKIFDLVILLQI